jgi:hypothetical protein
VLADFFLFKKVKEELVGLHLSQQSLRKAWEGVVHTIAEEGLCEKCIQIDGDYVKKY